jgi:hypothetical protein
MKNTDKFNYIDPIGDEYEFYFFIANNETKHISIKISFKNWKESCKRLNLSNILGQSFSLPMECGKIKWGAYNRKDGEHLMSNEGIKFANRLSNLLYFL